MKISVDAGAVCADKDSRFGNYIVTENLIKAFRLYYPKSKYFFYTFCKKPYAKNIQPKFFWSRLRVSVEEQIEKKDYYFGLNQALPLFTPAKIISFSHGLSFYFYPKFYPYSAQKMKKQHKQMIKRSYKIIVPSVKVKKEMYSIFPEIKCEVVVIPYGVPFDMLSNQKFKTSNLRFQKPFFLAVGMDHPIKNQNILPKSEYKFFIANKTSRRKLRLLYQQAKAFITTSLYESFNLPVLEALSLGCPVIGLKSAIIPELEPYVNLCQSEKELGFILEKAKHGQLKKPNVKEIRKKFSWKNYVANIYKAILK